MDTWAVPQPQALGDRFLSLHPWAYVSASSQLPSMSKHGSVLKAVVMHHTTTFAYSRVWSLSCRQEVANVAIRNAGPSLVPERRPRRFGIFLNHVGSEEKKVMVAAMQKPKVQMDVRRVDPKSMASFQCYFVRFRDRTTTEPFLGAQNRSGIISL